MWPKSKNWSLETLRKFWLKLVGAKWWWWWWGLTTTPAETRFVKTLPAKWPVICLKPQRSKKAHNLELKLNPNEMQNTNFFCIYLVQVYLVLALIYFAFGGSSLTLWILNYIHPTRK